VRKIYKIAPASAWREAERHGVYRGSADDSRDGFIHFSTAAQVAETARKHFAGQAGLFGTAQDVAWLAEQYLSRLCGRANSGALRIDLVREATSEQAYDPVLRRGLGWALKTSDDNSCGRLFSAQSIVK